MTRSVPPPTPPPSLLVVVAHPDDESLATGGLLAWCAQEGIRTSLLCLTRGGIGQVDDPERIRMGEERTRELQEASGVLGLAEVVVLDHRNGFLPWVDRAALEADIRAALQCTGAGVVVTFDHDGLYWHPDHIVVHERTTAAVAAMGAGAPALFYVSMPKGAMRAAWQAATDAACREGAEKVPAIALGVEVDAYGLFTRPTLRLDASAFAVRKLRALRCHRSQLLGDALARLPEEAAAAALGAEMYRRAEVGSPHETFLDRWAHPVPGTDPPKSRQ